MKLYSSNEHYKLYHGNMLDMLEVIQPNTIDSIITDPPYGLTSITKRFGNEKSAECKYGKDGSFQRLSKGFMGKEWDGSGIEYNIDAWRKCYEVLKPGGYLLAFGGSRTFHRIACAIEDAGFEIRDTIMWLYGSGFPKSMNIGLAIDKKNGVESIDTGVQSPNARPNCDKTNTLYESGTVGKNFTIKKATNEWSGWGTALKPSYESIIVAQKPYSIEIYLLIEILDILNEVMGKCQLNLNANIVEKISQLNQVKQIVEENIVLKNAESKMFTKEDLLEVMDMLQLILMENTNWNTELLCLNFLVEICNQLSKYTTETKINLITELKILKLLVVQDILENTIEENKTKQLGMKQNALTVEEFLKEEKLKLNYMNILSVQENAILQEKESNLHPSLNQIIVARKPFKGSLVDNIIENGVGGLNIDECRVGNETIKGGTMPDFRDIGQKSKEAIGIDKLSFGQVENAKRKPLDEHTGRFPANTILTYDDTDFEEVCGGFPNGGRNGSITKKYKINNRVYGDYGYCNTWDAYQDSGSASRYFYCAKASKKDRDEGCQELEDTVNACSNQAIAELKRGNDNFSDETNSTFNKVYKGKNTHPTVKPTDLMQYLVRLVSPNGATILDPFNGSGSTGKAVMYENKERNKNYKYIGIELTEEYLPISKARIEYLIDSIPEESKQDISTGQTNIFDFIKE